MTGRSTANNLPIFATLAMSLTLISTLTASATENQVALPDLAAEGWQENFDRLDGWKPLAFGSIDRHSSYKAAVLPDGGEGLIIRADQSASGLVEMGSFDPKQAPNISWRWRVEGRLPNADLRRKDTDDSGLRIYVMFPYDPDKASMGEQIKFELAKQLYGEYPPARVLAYCWGDNTPKGEDFVSPYTDGVHIFVLRGQTDPRAAWLVEHRNIAADYAQAFGDEMPNKAKLAIMADTDNTQANIVSYLDWIRLDGRAPD